MGSDDHGTSAGHLFSLIASARLHRLDPEEYLRDLFRVLGQWPRLVLALTLSSSPTRSVLSRFRPLRRSRRRRAERAVVSTNAVCRHGRSSERRGPCIGYLDSALAAPNAELQQLATDALCAPQPVVLGHVANQGNRLSAQARMLPGLGPVSPEQALASSMPFEDRLGLYQHDGVTPRR